MMHSHKKPISLEAIERHQRSWAKHIIEIGEVWKSRGDFRLLTQRFLAIHYAYHMDDITVQFKPTKASSQPFRASVDGALSYFIGGHADYPDDQGFALMPWSEIVFDNHSFFTHNHVATVMGRYTFVDACLSQTIVDYTFGYLSDEDAQLKIFLHHSSMPFIDK